MTAGGNEFGAAWNFDRVSNDLAYRVGRFDASSSANWLSLYPDLAAAADTETKNPKLGRRIAIWEVLLQAGERGT